MPSPVGAYMVWAKALSYVQIKPEVWVTSQLWSRRLDKTSSLPFLLLSPQRYNDWPSSFSEQPLLLFTGCTTTHSWFTSRDPEPPLASSTTIPASLRAGGDSERVLPRHINTWGMTTACAFFDSPQHCPLLQP